jgi:NAD(P)-dependent dehydrogenase (short-subunit alcohol dehydrogenase family)
MIFNGQTVMVTGAAGNLGRAVAQAFAGHGANLVLVDLDRRSLEQAYGMEDSRSMLAAADLLDQEQVGGVVQNAIDHFGRIDVLCNLAGGFRMGPPVHETTDADWNFLFDINTRTILQTVRALVPHMVGAGGGKIVNVGANSALHGKANMGAYGASKSAVIRLTESMAAELREKRINVNCVLPSIIDTPENRAGMPSADPSRWVSPSALADVIVFLASHSARAVHGAAIPVSGLS